MTSTTQRITQPPQNKPPRVSTPKLGRNKHKAKSPSQTPPPRTDGAAHAEQTTREWQPTFTRRESWTLEDRKRLMQMIGIREEDMPKGKKKNGKNGKNAH